MTKKYNNCKSPECETPFPMPPENPTKEEPRRSKAEEIVGVIKILERELEPFGGDENIAYAIEYLDRAAVMIWLSDAEIKRNGDKR